MATFPNPLTTMFLDKAIAERPTKAALKQNYIGLSLLPLKEVPDYELTWDIKKWANHMAGLYAMTGVPRPGTDPDFYQMMADVSNIMISRMVDEQSIMVLREPGEPALRTSRNARAKAAQKLREQIAVCDDEVETAIEYLITQALQGTITWPPTTAAGAAISPLPSYMGDISFSLSMGFRAAFVQNVSTLSGHNSRAGGGVNWQNAAANPLLDIEVLMELMAETTGMAMENCTAIMSRSVMSWIATRTNVVNYFKGTDSGQKYIHIGTLKEHMKSQLGLNVTFYDAKWTYANATASASGETENAIRFLKEGKVIFIPQGALGSDIAYFATAPTAGADRSYKSGKYTWIDEMTKPPWTTEVGVGIKGFPVLKSVREIAVLDVYA